VDLSSVTVVSSTEIVATVTPANTDPSEIAQVELWGSPSVLVFAKPVAGTATMAVNAEVAASPNSLNPVLPGMIAMAQANVQIDGCPTPTITSITPRTWTEGLFAAPTIIGNGFITAHNATAACPVSPVSVAVDKGGVAVSSVIVRSTTEITFIEKPDADDPTEEATVKVGTTPNAVASTVQIKGCTLPTTETTAFQGWETASGDPTVGGWEQTVSDLHGDSFSGRSVTEDSPSENPGEDTCWIPNDQGFTPGGTASSGVWPVGDGNTWGADSVGYTPEQVAFYRANKRAPCGFTAHQQMSMTCPDGAHHNYGQLNTLRANITATTVSSARAGQSQTEAY
jgi:hypothetical protein